MTTLNETLLKTNELVVRSVSGLRDTLFSTNEILPDPSAKISIEYYMPKNLLVANKVYWYFVMNFYAGVSDKRIDKVTVKTDVATVEKELTGAPFTATGNNVIIGPIGISDLSDFREFKKVLVTISFPPAQAGVAVGKIVMSKLDVLYTVKIGAKV
jgi:hypothetical protein